MTDSASTQVQMIEYRKEEQTRNVVQRKDLEHIFEDPINNHIMPPPVGVLSKVVTSNVIREKKRRAEKKILEEDSYVEALEKIIERDFFPNISKYQAKLEQMQSTGNATHSRNRSEYIPNMTPVSNWENDSNLDCASTDGRLEAPSNEHRHSSLDTFLGSHTSEDNASFEVLHQKDLEERRKRHHWMYEDSEVVFEGGAGVASGRKQGMLMLYHMNGTVLTQEERENFDKLVDRSEATIGDDRPAGPDLWRFRVRNQLMFYPEIEDSQDICLMHATSGNSGIIKSALPSLGDDSATPALLIQNAEQKKSSLEEPSTTARIGQDRYDFNNSRIGAIIREPKMIQHRNTNFSDEVLAAQMSILASPLELAHTPSIGSTGGSSDYGEGIENSSNYRTVKMTPSPMPGNSATGGESPFVTWGSVCGTPLVLDRTSGGEASNIKSGYTLKPSDGISFTIPPTPLREMLARSLDQRGKLKSSKTSLGGGGSGFASASTPMSMRPTPISGRATPGDANVGIPSKRNSLGSFDDASITSSLSNRRHSFGGIPNGKQVLKPAALALASKIHKSATALASPFGGSLSSVSQRHKKRPRLDGANSASSTPLI